VIDLPAINSWSKAEARTAFLRCCGSSRWADLMTARRPFRDEADLLAAAVSLWRGLTQADWLEAFAAHPRIGDVESLRKKFAATAAWSTQEQADVTGAAEDVLQALAEGNRAYEARFGYIFIICATGKTAAEMLTQLHQRLSHSPEEELHYAATEQEKITHLRLHKLTP
jgi:2-oxo-4-hydroxy-4-carboxy-5-ureidoimidazoline decarboxylase